MLRALKKKKPGLGRREESYGTSARHVGKYFYFAKVFSTQKVCYMHLESRELVKCVNSRQSEAKLNFHSALNNHHFPSISSADYTQSSLSTALCALVLMCSHSH